MKLHWDYQYPSHAKCKFCDTILHDNDDDSVKKRLFEHEEKICKEAKRRIHPTMHKIVCQGCEVIFVSSTQEENNKWMKYFLFAFICLSNKYFSSVQLVFAQLYEEKLDFLRLLLCLSITRDERERPASKWMCITFSLFYKQ